MVIPRSVMSAFFLHPPQTITPIPSGEINQTWLIADTHNNKSILQRLSPIFNEDMLRDSTTVTESLAKRGWEMPTMLLTLDKTPYCIEAFSGSRVIWRLTKYIDNDTRSRPINDTSESFRELGTILAKLHESLASIDYRPTFHLPHFHDTPHHINELQHKHAKLRGEAAALADAVLRSYDTIQPMPISPQQLIHGDPRTDNILFRNDRPFTFIDWDTVMVGSVWADVGDMLRSLVENHLFRNDSGDIQPKIRAFGDAYQATSHLSTDHTHFFHDAINAARHISLELISRYLYDIIYDTYWSWDAGRFSSRAESNLSRANTQWKICNALTTMEAV